MLTIRVFYKDIGFGMSAFLCYVAARNIILFFDQEENTIRTFFFSFFVEETAAFMKTELGTFDFKPVVQCVLEWGT